MSNEVLSAISQRRSNRGYEPRQISQEQLDALLTAALESPSARNSQPWHFTVVQKKEVLDAINANINPERDVFYGAPTVIFISAARDGGFFAPIDCGIAVQTIALAAQSMGLGSVILGMPRAAFESSACEALQNALMFPHGHEFKIAIAVGYPTVTKDAHPVADGKVDYVR